jgi:hypothetical protein
MFFTSMDNRQCMLATTSELQCHLEGLYYIIFVLQSLTYHLETIYSQHEVGNFVSYLLSPMIITSQKLGGFQSQHGSVWVCFNSYHFSTHRAGSSIAADTFFCFCFLLQLCRYSYTGVQTPLLAMNGGRGFMSKADQVFFCARVYGGGGRSRGRELGD